MVIISDIQTTVTIESLRNSYQGVHVTKPTEFDGSWTALKVREMSGVSKTLARIWKIRIPLLPPSFQKACSSAHFFSFFFLIPAHDASSGQRLFKGYPPFD